MGREVGDVVEGGVAGDTRAKMGEGTGEVGEGCCGYGGTDEGGAWGRELLHVRPWLGTGPEGDGGRGSGARGLA